MELRTALRASLPLHHSFVKKNVFSPASLTTQSLPRRIIFLGSRISEDVCNRVCASLMALEAIDPKAEIKMYVNSTGASAYAAVAIVDIMKQIQCPISTVGMGMVRFCLKN